MRRIAFITAILGLFLLLSLLIFLQPISIKKPEELSNSPDNKKVTVSGKIVKESRFGSQTLLTLNNNIELLCECPYNLNYKNKNISALGIVDDFAGKKRIRVLRLSLI